MASKPPREDSRRRRRPARRGWNPLIIGTSAVGLALVVVALTWMVLHFTKSSRRGEPRLIGSWQSDADATIAERRKSRPVTEQQEQAMRKLFGKMKITYTDTTVTSELDGVLDTQPYQVTNKDGESAMIKFWSALSKKDEIARIRFIDNDTYWVDAEQFAFSECFRRIK